MLRRPPPAGLGVTVTPGTAAETALSFTVTPRGAEACAYVCVEEGAAIPSAEEILAGDGILPAGGASAVEVAQLKPGTPYAIVAAASDGKTAVRSERIVMTTLESAAIVFTSAAAEIFTAGDLTITFTQESETYRLLLNFSYDSDARWVLPAGTYTIGGSGPGSIESNPQYTYLELVEENNRELALASGTATVAFDENGVYDVRAAFATDEGDFEIRYTGQIEGVKFTYDFTATEAKYVDERDEAPGRYLIEFHDESYDYDLRLEFFADPASATLPAGTYVVGDDGSPGTIGSASHIQIFRPSYLNDRFAAGGTVVVSQEGDVYTFVIRLALADGYPINGSFAGRIVDNRS